MSNQNSQTVYSLMISGNASNGLISMTSNNDGWTDEFALSLQTALEALTWPEGTSFVVNKAEVETLTSVAGGTPAAFS